MSNLKNIDKANLAAALSQGLISWFTYFEMIRGVPADQRQGGK